MQFLTNKAKVKTTVIAIVLLMSSVTLMTNVSVKAQVSATQPTAGPLPAGVTPKLTVTTIGAYLSVTPSLVGVGQPFLVNMWTVPPLPANKMFVKAYVVTITKPDGTNVSVGPLNSFPGDTTAYFTYVADQTGTYKFNFNRLGEYFPTGRYFNGYIVTNSSGTAYDSCYINPDSAPEVDVSAQSALVASWPPAPLPTDYWTRPVEPYNREWWPILGYWPNTGIVGGEAAWDVGGAEWNALYPNTNTYMSSYNFDPWIQGPTSAHIVWKRQNALGGLIGGTGGDVSFTLPGLTGSGYPSIIFEGRCYQTIVEPAQTPALINGTYQYQPGNVSIGAVTMWQCYDLRTGKVYWERPLAPGETAPTFVELALQAPEVAGATARVGRTPYLDVITGPSGSNPGRLIKYDPWTGAVAINVTAAPTGVSAGTLYGYPYVLSVQSLGGGVYRLINWTIENNAGNWVAAGGGGVATVDNFTARIKGNITFPFSSIGTADYESMLTCTTGSLTSNASGNAEGVFLMGASLTTGQLLWNETLNAATGYNEFSGIDPIADHGKYATRNRDGSYYCFDMYTGKFLWKSPLPSYPWGVFESYAVQSAYGYLFTDSYAGVQAIDWNTGKQAWLFTALTPYSFETPYEVNGTGVYSWHAAGFVADGMVYTFNSEHTPSQPITRGWRLFCLNATTGQEIWSITTGEGVPGSRYFMGAICDGYMAFVDEYDITMYVYGRGLSATTVSTPDTAVPLGTQVLIKGTVLDQSPAQPGTPCVSHDSMATQMEYLHMQLPINGIAHNVTMTGVPVILTAIGSDGTVIDLGTTTTNPYYGTFSLAWTPPKQDTYTITATFAGDNSYGSSSAGAGLLVSPAPAASPTPTPPAAQPVPDYTAALIGIAIAIIAAIAIVGIILYRKKP
jgi:outer membrane protein assembly factor BamB